MRGTMQTYKETVLRYRVLRHDELPEEHKVAYRAEGIDPDDNWALIWSFTTKEDAIKALMEERERAPWWQTFRFRDAGAEEVIERPVY
tara:strand:- start:90659 stop:90922 length:264 start_codon:yes stop_codon:yes gene_type:complete